MSAPLNELCRARQVAEAQTERVESRRRAVSAAKWMLDEWPYTATLRLSALRVEAREACGDPDLTDGEVDRAVKIATGA